MEYKCRSAANRAHLEEERIEDLRRKGVMSRDHIFCETNSNDRNRFEIIPCETERLQILHHAHLGDLQSSYLAVGNSKLLLSCTRMRFQQELMEAYGKTLSLIFNICLEPFHDCPAGGKDLVASASEEFMARVAEAAEVNKESLVDLKTVMFNF